MFPRLLSIVSICSSFACGGVITEVLSASPTEVTSIASPVQLAATPSFADERGGGFFIDLAGRVVRLRADGTQAALESHPQNPVPPGPAKSVWPMGPYTALVVTERGLFVADAAWLIAPSWQQRLSAEGFVASATTTDGVVWIAHADGLFRIEGGELKELKANGQSIAGLTALAIGPADDLRPGVWFAQGSSVSVAAQLSASSFSIRDAKLTTEDLAGGVRGIAAVSAAPSAGGNVWVITPKLLLEKTAVGWRRYELGKTPKQLMAAGRFLWMQSGDGLFRYDADAKSWSSARGLEAVPRLLAVDAAGAAWVRVGEKTLSISPTPSLRLTGLFSGQVVSDPEGSLELVVPAEVALESFTWRFDDGDLKTVDLAKGQLGAPPQQTLRFHSLAGLDAAGRLKHVSFASLTDGLHTLELNARFPGGIDSQRRLHFELAASATIEVSYERDIRPLAEARCDKCHAVSTEPELKTYEQWKANAAGIAAAVAARRMPADGPLDAANIQMVQRWVSGGTVR